MELPKCLEDYEPDLVLTINDRRKLIKGLAKDGPNYIDKFVRDHSENKLSGIAKLARRMRTKIESQIKGARQVIERKFKNKKVEIENQWNNYIEPMSSEQFSEGQTKNFVEEDINSRLIEILSQDDTLKFIIDFDESDYEENLSWWEKFKAIIIKALSYLIDLFRRFYYWLKNKLGREKKSTTEDYPEKRKRLSNILLRFPSGMKIGNSIQRNLDNALATNPDFKYAIDKELRTKGVTKSHSKSRTTWRKPKPGSKEHIDNVNDLIAQRVKQAIRREERRITQQLQRKQRRVKQRRQDKAHLEVRRREINAKLKQMEKQKQEELEKLKNQYRKQIDRTVKNALVNELEDAGYVQKDRKETLNITTRLIDRFAEIVLSDELQKLPGKRSLTAGSLGASHGIYEKKKLQTSSEISRMDIVTSMVNARLAHPQERHIYDSDIITHKDIYSTITHVVLIFDKSGSMEENNRIIAAKRAVLALYKAVKHRNQKNIVDFIAFDSTVQILDILQAWRSTPSGFTNTGEALGTARELIRNSKADFKIIYLITDGLPEAYTDKITGQPRAGDLVKSLRIAVKEAEKLRNVANLKLSIILLEPKDTMFINAANTIAKAVGGSVIISDPNELATEMLTNYIDV